MKAKRVHLVVDGINIEGEFYIPEEEGKNSFPALCICHGIPAGPTDPNDRGYPLLAEEFCSAGFATMIFNFRGSGISGGNLDLAGWSKDLEAVIDYLYSCPEIEKSSLSIMGFSGGAAVSVYVISHNPKVTSAVLCSCPAQFKSLVNKEEVELLIDRFRSVGTIRDKDFPPSTEEWLRGFELIEPIQWIDKISPRPLLILHGEEDETIEVSQAWALYQKAREPKEIAIIAGGKHKLRLNEAAMDIALGWLKTKAN